MDGYCCFEFFLVVSALEEESVHVMVIQECRQKELLGKMRVVFGEVFSEGVFDDGLVDPSFDQLLDFEIQDPVKRSDVFSEEAV